MTLVSFSRLISSLLLLLLAIGVVGTLLPAFNYLPVLGYTDFSWQPWLNLYQAPELYSSVMLTLFSGITATIIALFIAFATLSCCYDTRWMRYLQASLSPVLAIPHAAMAIGLLFLLSPSGWVIRLLSPDLTGFDRPPNWLTVQDPYALSLILALVIKETPYLLFVLLASAKQLPVNESIQFGQTLGYSRLTIWRKLLLPLLYPMIRLPIFVVLAFSLTVIDLAIIIGPNTPSTFAVTLFRWFQDADLTLRLQASAGSILLIIIIAISCWCWQQVYLLGHYFTRASYSDGIRRTMAERYLKLGSYAYLLIMSVAALALLVLPLWAFAKRWRFPDALPSKWSLDKFNTSIDLLTQLSVSTLLIALSASVIALLMSILVLEHKRIFSGKIFWFDRFIYIPILLPQVGFLFGIQVALIWSHLNGSLAAVILLHVLYCLPYVYLTLQGSYLKFEQGYYTQALALTQRPLHAFVQVKLAMLKGPLLSATALGVAVSIAQYLPTLVAGEGRINTLTTEAVALAASGERKQASLMALLQACMPLLVFILAHFVAKHWTSLRLAIYYRAGFQKPINTD